MKNLFDINLNLNTNGIGAKVSWGNSNNNADNADEVDRLTLAMEMLVEKNKHLEAENKRLGKELEVANNAPRNTGRTFMDNAKEGAFRGEIMLLKKQNKELSDALIKANKIIKELKDSKAISNVETIHNGSAEKELKELKHTLMQKENEISRLIGIVDTQAKDIHELTNVVSSMSKIIESNMVFTDKGGEFVKHQEELASVNEVDEDSSSSAGAEEDDIVIIEDEVSSDPVLVEDEAIVVNDNTTAEEDNEPIVPKKHRSEWIPTAADVEKITLDDNEGFVDYGLHITKDNVTKNKPVGKAPKVSDDGDIIIE